MPLSRRQGFDSNVFINCPFDDDYLDLLRPTLFTVISLGYSPRLASERSDSGEGRIDKIEELVCRSRYSIHDLSRLKAKKAGEVYRMNMPFELGLDRGCKMFGEARLKRKKCLILGAKPHDYKRALSDLSGVDIKAHRNSPAEIVRAVRSWFVETVGVTGVSGPAAIWYRFTEFESHLYRQGKRDGFFKRDLDTMAASEYIGAIRRWVARN